jgi:hypothetical protein
MFFYLLLIKKAGYFVWLSPIYTAFNYCLFKNIKKYVK